MVQNNLRVIYGHKRGYPQLISNRNADVPAVLQFDSRMIFNAILIKAPTILIVCFCLKHQEVKHQEVLEKKNAHCHFVTGVGLAQLIDNLACIVICRSQTVRNIFKCPVMDIQQIIHSQLLWQASKMKTIQTVLITIMTVLEPHFF